MNVRRCIDPAESRPDEDRSRSVVFPLTTDLERRTSLRCDGFTFTEVLVAMVILVLGVAGALSGFQAAQRGLDEGGRATRALALAESRLEAKRSTAWKHVLHDDLDGDGRFEVAMHTGRARGFPDPGPGAYTATWKDEGVAMMWSVTPDRPGPFWQVGSMLIQVWVRYETGSGRWRELRLGTIRANPSYIGPRERQ